MDADTAEYITQSNRRAAAMAMARAAAGDGSISGHGETIDWHICRIICREYGIDYEQMVAYGRANWRNV